MTVSSVSDSHISYRCPSIVANPYPVDRVPKDIALIEDFRITPPHPTLCPLLGAKTVVVKAHSILNAEGSGWGFLSYDMPGKIAPALYEGPIEKYEPHGYGSIHFSDGLGQYEGLFTNGIPGGFGVHRTSSGAMKRIGEIHFDVFEGGMAFVLKGIGEYRGNGFMKAGFFHNDLINGEGMLLTEHDLRAVVFFNDEVNSNFSLQAPSFSFALKRLQEKPIHRTPVVSYLGDIASGPPSDIPLASDLIIRDPKSQKEVSRFPKGGTLTGFDASGNTQTWGSYSYRHLILELHKKVISRIESQFHSFEPHGYGRKHCFNEDGTLRAVAEGSFGPDPVGRSDFTLHGFGRILDPAGALIKEGFVQNGFLYGPGIRTLTPREKNLFPGAVMLRAFFERDIPMGGPAVYSDSEGKIVRKGFYAPTLTSGVSFYPTS